MQNILVLGSSSFIGQNLIIELQNRLSANTMRPYYVGVDYNYIQDKKYNIFYNIDLRSRESISLVNDILDYYNIDCIINLASNVGINIFNDNSALFAGIDNYKLLSNFIDVLKYVKRPNLNIVQFSTSEVYGNTNSLETFSITNQSPRSIYSQIKILSETLVIELYNQGYIKNYHIIRPFNPSGRFQTQGVVYDMFTSAIKHSKIWYRKNTTRTITDIQHICQNYVDDILTTTNTIKNYYYDTINNMCCSVELETLAIVIKEYCEQKCNKTIQLIPIDTDTIVQYRHYDILKTADCVKPYIFNILDQIYSL